MNHKRLICKPHFPTKGILGEGTAGLPPGIHCPGLQIDRDDILVQAFPRRFVRRGDLRWSRCFLGRAFCVLPGMVSGGGG